MLYLIHKPLLKGIIDSTLNVAFTSILEKKIDLTLETGVRSWG